MAYSKTAGFSTVMGNKRVIGFTVTSDATSGAVESGLDVIEGFSLSPISAATASPKARMNVNSGLTANNGSFHLSATTSGDDFFVVCYGH